jgi:hypothetical protein
MRLNPRVANSIASALPSLRVALLVGGGLLLAESVVLATSLFVAAWISFVASVVGAARIYRVRGPRPTDGQAESAPRAQGLPPPVVQRRKTASAHAAGS